LLLLLVSAGLLLGAIFPELLEKAWIRGSGPRPLIWKQFLSDVAQAPILGQGLISQVSYHISGQDFSTAHNAYLQTLWAGGAIGLGLFLMLLFSACRRAWHLGKEHGDFAILSIFLFSACVMFTGVDTLVDRPREQWMLFWFPLALLISYQVTGSRDFQRMAR
jgi:O-antigen ligase